MFIFILTPEQRRDLEHIVKTDPRKLVRTRAAALLLLDNGADESLMTAALGTDSVTPCLWFVAFEEGGADSLVDQEALDSFSILARLLIRAFKEYGRQL